MQEWIEAALIVADGEDMPDSEVIPTWPADVASHYPALTVGALREWQAARAQGVTAPMTRIAEKKLEQMGATVQGVLAKNESGAWVAVSEAGRVMWLDNFEGQAATNREDALDCALSGQSYHERLIDSVCAELNAMAFDLKAAHTVNGDWPARERDTLEKHDHLKRMAVELRKIKAARAQPEQPSDGVVPEEPTEKMLEAAMSERDSQHPANAKRYLQHVWKRMYAAAPAAPAVQGGGEDERYPDFCVVSYGHPGYDLKHEVFTSVDDAAIRANALDRKGFSIVKRQSTYTHNGEQPSKWRRTLERIARYPRTRSEELSAPGMREMAREALSDLYPHLRENVVHNGEQGGEWVRCDERLPTEADGNLIWSHDQKRGSVELCSWAWSHSLFKHGYITHWQPTGLTRPQPPKSKEG